MVDGSSVELERERQAADGPALQLQPPATAHLGAVDAEGGQFLVSRHETDRPVLRITVVGHPQHRRLGLDRH
jgi:hypothetical protein